MREFEIRIPFTRLESEENDPLSPGEVNGLRAWFNIFLTDPDLVYRFGPVEVYEVDP